MSAQLVNTCTPGRGIQVWTPTLFERLANRPNRFVLEENLKRVRFFSGGKYSYKPSDAYLKAYAKFKLHVKSIQQTIVNEF